jgi:hypothetical protein
MKAFRKATAIRMPPRYVFAKLFCASVIHGMFLGLEKLHLVP